jgi:IS30 family transposase
LTGQSGAQEMKYHHLTEGERYQIQALNAEGFGPTAIGQRIGRWASSKSKCNSQ